MPVILTMNLKLFRNHGGIYRLRKYFKKDSGEMKPLEGRKDSGEMKPLGVQGNMRGYILEGNSEGLGS